MEIHIKNIQKNLQDDDIDAYLLTQFTNVNTFQDISQQVLHSVL